MSLDTIMNLQITVESRAPEQAAFGTPLLFGYHTAWLEDRVREYAEADEMLSDGFTADDALYKAAVIVKSQNPCPPTFKIGRRATPLTQTIQLTPTNTTEGFKYKGTVGGAAFVYTVPGGATTTSVANGLVGAINALGSGLTGTVATNGSAGEAVSANAGPWELTSGQTLVIAVDTDVPASPDTVTFTGTAASRECANGGTWDLSGGKSLTVKIDGGSVQTVSFVNGNFAVPTAATASEVAAVINGGLKGASATVTSGTKVTITSDRRGTGSHVEVTGGSANDALGFVTTVANGGGNVVDIGAVTGAEAKTLIEQASPALVDTAPGGFLTLTSPTFGADSKVLVTAASTATGFGFDNATYTGETGGAMITCTATNPGVVIEYSLGSGFEIKDATVDTTTDNELPEVNAEDADWYGLLVIDSQSKATSLNAAAWTESHRKICVIQTADSEVLDPDTDDDILSDLQDSAYARTCGIYHRYIGGVEWLAAGWEAGRLTANPGSDTWAFKAVAGVRVDTLSQAQESSIEKKHGSHYTMTGGLPITFEGHSGSGEYMDTVRFIDWVYARMRETVLGLLANNPKIPFTDDGVDILRAAIMSVIQMGIAANGFSKTPAPTVTAPLVKDVPAIDRINRTLPDVSWTANLAGAIHRMTPVYGRVTV